MNKRVRFIDISRAIAIILIVFGHTIVHNPNTYSFFKFIYSFHVVLFFIISGYTYENNKGNLEYIKRKFLTLMVPYFIFSIVFLVPYFIFGDGVRQSMNIETEIKVWPMLKEVLYGVGCNGALKQNTALWFLPALFSCEVLYKLIDNIKANNKDIWVTITLIAISYSSTFLLIVLPWGINSALMLTIFFQIGYLLKQYNCFEKIHKNNIAKIIMFFLASICIYMQGKNITVSCVDYRYGNYMIFFLASLILSVLAMYISFMIKENRAIEYIGKNTISIFLFHKLLIVVLQTKINWTASILRGGNFFECVCVSVIITFLCVGVSLLIGEFIKRFLPFLYGGNKKNEGKNHIFGRN